VVNTNSLSPHTAHISSPEPSSCRSSSSWTTFPLAPARSDSRSFTGDPDVPRRVAEFAACYILTCTSTSVQAAARSAWRRVIQSAIGFHEEYTPKIAYSSLRACCLPERRRRCARGRRQLQPLRVSRDWTVRYWCAWPESADEGERRGLWDLEANILPKQP